MPEKISHPAVILFYEQVEQLESITTNVIHTGNNLAILAALSPETDKMLTQRHRPQGIPFQEYIKNSIFCITYDYATGRITVYEDGQAQYCLLTDTP